MGRKKVIISVINDISYDQRMLKTARSLNENGYEVLIVGRILSTSKKISSHFFKSHRIKCSFNKGKLFYIEFNLRLFFFLINQKPNIWLPTDLDTLLAIRMAHKIKGGHLIYDAHEFFTEVPELSERPFSKWIWSVLEKILLPGIRFCYTVSPGVAFLFQKKYKKKFDLVRNLPYKLDLPIVNTQKSRIIIYQGALNVGRGLEMAIRAMRHIDGELYLVGEGDLSKDLRAMVLRLKLKEKVKFLGNVLPEELPSITRKASIGLNLLENRGLNYYYSLANKFFDYIEAGIPQISMRFPDYDKINQEYEIALLMDGLNELILAKAIQQLLDDNELYDKLKKNTISAREQLCWQNEEKALLQIFGKLK